MKNKFLKDRIYVVETNIDDMSPVVYETVFEKLYSAGALEVFLIPVQMKKVRPGILLTALVPKNKLEKIAEVIFRETTSFGMRYHEAKRLKLLRKTGEKKEKPALERDNQLQSALNLIKAIKIYKSKGK